MITENSKKVIRNWLPDYLARYKNLSVRQCEGRANFRCLNPEHNDHDPSMNVDRKNMQCHCFGCGAKFDVFDLIGIDYSLDSFPEQYAKAIELYGDPADQTGESGPIVNPVPRPAPEAEPVDHSGEIRQAAMQLEDPAALAYLASRGISPETAARFAVGYMPAFHASSGETWKAITLPTGDPLHSYTARNINAQCGRYENRGRAALFNARAVKEETDNPLFIVEGEIDALSIEEVGGCAVGLGSATNVSLIDAVADQIPADRLIILALDNDRAGMIASEKLGNILKAHNRNFETFNPYGTHKDANEALKADRAAFTDIITNAAATIQKRRLQEYRDNESSLGRIDEFIDSIYQSMTSKPISTGFPQFDKAIGGGLYSGLYVIGGVSSLGKTTLALQIGDQIAAAGQDVMIFSLEMSRNELIGKSISRITLEIGLEQKKTREYAADYRGVTDGSKYTEYSQKQKDRIAEAIRKYKSYARHLFIIEAQERIGATVIAAEIEKHKSITGNYPVVIIDYLQILKPADVHYSDKQAADTNISDLKRLARNMPIIVISSVNRESYKDGNKPAKNAGKVSMSDLKESGGIEYGADCVIGLQFSAAGEYHMAGSKAVSDYDEEAEKRADPRKVTAVVLKARFDQVYGCCNFNYIPAFNYFMER